jgi:hypothetical protein
MMPKFHGFVKSMDKVLGSRGGGPLVREPVGRAVRPHDAACRRSAGRQGRRRFWRTRRGSSRSGNHHPTPRSGGRPAPCVGVCPGWISVIDVHRRGGQRADQQRGNRRLEILEMAVSRSDRWSRHSDLNRGPAVYETAALPLSYVGAEGRILRSQVRAVGRAIEAASLLRRSTALRRPFQAWDPCSSGRVVARSPSDVATHPRCSWRTVGSAT